MRVLLSTPSPAGYMRPPQLGDEQIVCGPDWADDRAPGGRWRSLQTPVGGYDLGLILAKLPPDQQPDVVACLVDASWRNLPGNLAAFSGPKVLLIADTHHLQAPLTTMIRYAAAERYDRIVFLYDRHHAAFFRAAGLRNLFWFPGLTFPHRDTLVRAGQRPGARLPQVAFVGQAGPHHPRRTRLLNALGAAKLPVAQKQLAQADVPSFYGASLLGFNSSLNGDLNLRVFEILAGGALLVSDRLAPAAGLGHLLQDGRDCVLYDDEAGLVEKVRHHLQNPREAQKMGEAGAKWFFDTMNEPARRRMFQALALDGVPPAPFPLPEAELTQVHFTGGRELLAHMMIYEGVQELHRTQETVRVGLDATVPDQIGRMFATLPRVGLANQAETGPADLAVVSREQVASAPVAAARRLWCWDAGPADLPGLECRLAVPGYVALSRQLAVFEHRETAADTLAAADQALAAGNIALAAGFTQGILQRDPQNAAALVLSTRVAFQAGDTELGAESLKLLRAAAAGHPQIAALESELAQRQNPLTTLLERGWKQFADGETVEAARTAQQLMKLYPPHAEVCLLFARCMAKIWRLDDACTAYRQAIVMAPRETIYWRERAQVLALMGRHGEAFNDLLQAAGHAPDDLELQEEIARTAVILGHRPIAREATEAVLARRPGDAAALARLAAINDEAADAEGCDLIVCHLEISRLHGTGVLLHRFFAGATNLVTLRSRSLYQGKFELPGLHLVLDTQDKPLAEIEQQMRRLLAGLKIRRILCVPYYPCDFVHGVLARRITGAPLCAYVMDDQTVHGTGVPAGVARSLFSAADLRLAISPEMSRAYERTFGQPFGVLPPILASTAERVENHWRPAGGAAVHCALVGNIWSPRQFEQLRACVRGSRVRIDWFGNADVPWLPQDRKQLERDGIHCRGFIPESELARRLAGYPFVVVPSGELDGTENNEWLTRLSLPSRMVFIFAQTFTPMLVLGHPDTAAARFVARLDLGRCASYEPAAARAAMRELMTPAVRDGIMASARRAAPAFVMPRAGEWIWQSLAAGRPLPTALDALAMTVPAEPLLEKISA